MYVGIVIAVVIGKRINQRSAALAGCTVVEVDQRFALHRPLQDREVASHCLHVKGAYRFRG